MELISRGIHPLKLLFATFLENYIATSETDMQIIKVKWERWTYKVSKGKTTRTLREPVIWLFCKKLQSNFDKPKHLLKITISPTIKISSNIQRRKIGQCTKWRRKIPREVIEW